MSRREERVKSMVRQHRLLTDMTQLELARRVGVSRQTIHSIEKGRYNPSVGLAIRLSGVFGVSVEALFELEEEESDG